MTLIVISSTVLAVRRLYGSGSIDSMIKDTRSSTKASNILPKVNARVIDIYVVSPESNFFANFSGVTVLVYFHWLARRLLV